MSAATTTEGTKRCNRCGETKPLDSFHRMSASPDGRQYKCKPCGNAIGRAWEAKNIDRVRELRRRGDIRRYGIEPEDYDRILKQQGGKCAICGGGELRPGDSLHIDHCHESHIVRGLLCGNCNRGLGMFKDNIDLLLTAIGYLEVSRA